jgi:exoDNase_III: exodeoxyribonuclease III
MLRFISWNVNGLRACVGKDFENQFKELDADFFCLQETKMQEGQLDLQFEGYESYWNYAEKKRILWYSHLYQAQAFERKLWHGHRGT